jgi:hypothetical protein
MGASVTPANTLAMATLAVMFELALAYSARVACGKARVVVQHRSESCLPRRLIWVAGTAYLLQEWAPARGRQPKLCSTSVVSRCMAAKI